MYCYVVKMEAVWSSKTLVSSYHTAWCNKTGNYKFYFNL